MAVAMLLLRATARKIVTAIRYCPIAISLWHAVVLSHPQDCRLPRFILKSVTAFSALQTHASNPLRQTFAMRTLSAPATHLHLSMDCTDRVRSRTAVATAPA